MNRLYEVEVARLTSDEAQASIQIITYVTAESGYEAVALASKLLPEWSMAGASFRVVKEVDPVCDYEPWIVHYGPGPKKALDLVWAPTRELALDVAKLLQEKHPVIGPWVAQGFVEIAYNIDRNFKGVWE